MLFFSPKGVGVPCGMFTLPHIISLIICLFLIGLGLYLSKKLLLNHIYLIIKIIAILVTILEIIKIGYNLYYGYTNLDSWFPLAFCSLFIYSLWMGGFGRGIVKSLGATFLVFGGIAAGGAFLIFPSTSLQMHPLFHYLSIYSMLFHSLMVYVGLLLYIYQIVIVNKKNYLQYICFCLVFMIIAIIINKIYNCNMMFLREPFNIPIPLLREIQENMQWLYTIIIGIVYLVGPPSLVKIISLIKIREKKDV